MPVSVTVWRVRIVTIWAIIVRFGNLTNLNDNAFGWREPIHWIHPRIVASSGWFLGELQCCEIALSFIVWDRGEVAGNFKRIATPNLHPAIHFNTLREKKTVHYSLLKRLQTSDSLAKSFDSLSTIQHIATSNLLDTVCASSTPSIDCCDTLTVPESNKVAMSQRIPSGRVGIHLKNFTIHQAIFTSWHDRTVPEW